MKNSTQPIAIATWEHGYKANIKAYEVLTNNGTALDAIEFGINETELDPQVRTVGYGGYTDYKGGNPVNKLLSSLSDGFTQAQNALSSFTEVGSQLGGLGKSLSMPKIGSILKQKSQFLPISKLGGMFV